MITEPFPVSSQIIKTVYKEKIMKASDLKDILHRIDRRSYPAYKDTKGRYDFGKYTLNIDHVQGDPFASPSKLSVNVSNMLPL